LIEDDDEVAEITEVLAAVAGPGGIADATAEFRQLVNEVTGTGRKGSMTFVLEVERTGSTGRRVNIKGRWQSKLPKPEPEEAVFYVGDAGSLHQHDPFQERLPLGDAPTGPGALPIAGQDRAAGAHLEREDDD
jgi:hypothetical protein